MYKRVVNLLWVQRVDSVTVTKALYEADFRLAPCGPTMERLATGCGPDVS